MPKGIEIGTHSLCFGRFIFLSHKLSVLCGSIFRFCVNIQVNFIFFVTLDFRRSCASLFRVALVGCPNLYLPYLLEAFGDGSVDHTAVCFYKLQT